jgi:Putative Actinobacterial Holin-X, holin superfamily III
MATRVGEDRSVGQLLGDVTRELQELMRKELELAKAETKEELQRAAAAGKGFGIAAFAGYFALIMLSFAAAWALTAIIPTGWAFFAVGMFYAVVAAFMALRGRKKLQEFSPVPEETVETLKEDVQWLKSRKS